MADDALIYQLASAARLRQARKRRHTRRDRRRASQDAPALSPTQTAGQRAEQAAKAYLERSGLTILGQNLRARAGEIDLIADEDGTLVFVEVRLRRSCQYGGALASVTPRKQSRLIRAACVWLPAIKAQYYAGHMPPCRFDVIGVDDASVQWIRNAFSA